MNENNALNWILECVENMVNIIKTNIYTGKRYQGNSASYLNILVNEIVSRYVDIDWDEMVRKWKGIKAQNNNNVSIDLFTCLNAATKSQVVGQLSNRCSLGNVTYNEILNDNYDLAIHNHRKAVFSRWDVIGGDFRKKVIDSLSRQPDEVVLASNKLLVEQLSANPQIEFLNEFVDWEIGESNRKLYIRKILDKMQLETCATWVSETINLMNRDGFHRWKGFSVEYATEKGKVNYNLLKTALETSLDLGQDRAKLALTILSSLSLSRTDLRYFRDKVIQYYNEYPELVDRFGYRFKVSVR